MSLLLEQLVYTSFPGVGFMTLGSVHVPPEIREAFIQQIVYRHWDTYNPPRSGYRAIYLYQVAPEHSLFGWLDNDGQDDFGRRQIPYFHCYYYLGRLHTDLLEDIFTCLYRGPIALIDRQLPSVLKTIVVSDVRSYQTVDTGVAISLSIRARSHIALEQNKLLDLFIAVDGEIVVKLEQHQQQEDSQPLTTSTSIPDCPLFKQEATSVQQLETATRKRPISLSEQDTILGSEALLDMSASDTVHLTSTKKSIFLMGMAIGITTVLAATVGIYYFLQPPPPASPVQQNSLSRQVKVMTR